MLITKKNLERRQRLQCGSNIKEPLKAIVVSSLVCAVRMTSETVTSGYVGASAMQLAGQGVGSVPAAVSDQVLVGATHPVLDGGELLGHGGTAVRVFVGLTQSQNHRLEQMGQVESPQGRRGEFYWPLKTDAAGALQSGATAAGCTVRDIVLRPVSITFVGLRDMISNGSLYAVDGQQWRLYAPLRIPSARDVAGNLYYVIHEPYTL